MSRLAGLEGEVARGIRRDEAVEDLGQLRLGPEVVRVGDELGVLLRHIFGEHERTGADRLLGEAVLAQFFGRLLTDHVAAMVVHDDAEQARNGLLQRDLDGVFVGGLDLVEGAIIRRKGRAFLGCGPVQRIDRVCRGELAIAVMALHALAQLEGPFLAVRRGGPALGEVRFDEFGREFAGLDPHQPVEHPVQQRLAGRAGIQMRVEHAGIRALHADGQHRLLCQRRRGQQRAGQHGGDDWSGSFHCCSLVFLLGIDDPGFAPVIAEQDDPSGARILSSLCPSVFAPRACPPACN